MSLIKCPICKKRFDSASSQTLPFCSSRCRQIDMGRWLGEAYGLPRESPDDNEREKQEDGVADEQ